VGGLVPASWVRIPPSPLNRVLNTIPAEPGHKPVELSRRVLREAVALAEPERCAALDELTGGLRGLDPAGIEGDEARIAFWANLYNALLLHRLCLKPVRGSIARQPWLFATAAYAVGGRPHTLNLIEHGLLRRNRRPPYAPRRPLRRSDPRMQAAPSRLDPRIHFALNCGARSCPPVQVYGPTELDDQLETATRAYLEGETTVDREAGSVRLPGLMRLYAADFGGRDGQLEFAARRLPELRALLDDGAERLDVGYERFDWTAI